MIDPLAFVHTLKDLGVTYFTGVPDSLLKNFCSCLVDQAADCHHIIAANEGNAIGLAIGHHLGTGGIPLVYLQNSGLGNAINPLLSLADEKIYGIPMILLIGWRGHPDMIDEPQHVTQGATTIDLLKTMNIETLLVDKYATLEQIKPLVSVVGETSKPVAIVVKSGTFQKYRNDQLERKTKLISRERTIEIIIECAPKEARYVATTGKSSRELFEIRNSRNETHSNDFLTVGGMGHASQIAAALAHARPEHQIICLDGDGALLMHMGSLAITAASQPKNFYHIILNNGSHESVGGQPTVGQKIDISSIALNCGYNHSRHVVAKSEGVLTAALIDFFSEQGPAFFDIHLANSSRDNLGRPTTPPLQNKIDFMESLRNCMQDDGQ